MLKLGGKDIKYFAFEFMLARFLNKHDFWRLYLLYFYKLRPVVLGE
ncbi:hypothetical protein AAIR98_000864 [Elusimicrobium simillimum]